MTSFLTGLISSIFFLSVLLIIEYVTRRNNYKKELTRRLAHFLSGLFGIVMGLTLDSWVFITFTLVFLVIISTSYVVKLLTSIHDVRRKTFGEILLPLGILTSYLISGPTTTFTVAVLILSISDPLAGIIGELKLFNKKRLAGSAFFFLSAFFILVLFFKAQQLMSLLAIALVVTIVEKYSTYGTDNLSIPLSVSLLLKVLF